jgi:membrane protein
VLLMWLYLSAYVLLMGAEMNAELEHQTERDTTAGPEKPMGARGAQVADTVAPSA